MPGHSFNHFTGKKKKSGRVKRQKTTRKQRRKNRHTHINKFEK